MQRKAFLPFWVCPSSMSSSIVQILVCSSQKCRKQNRFCGAVYFFSGIVHRALGSFLCLTFALDLDVPVSCGICQSVVRGITESLWCCSLWAATASVKILLGPQWRRRRGGWSRGWSLCSTERRMCDQRGHMRTFRSCVTNGLKHNICHWTKDWTVDVDFPALCLCSNMCMMITSNHSHDTPGSLSSLVHHAPHPSPWHWLYCIHLTCP